MSVLTGSNEPSRQISDGSSEGNIFGLSPADNISFYGALPITQPTSSAQASIVDGSGGVANPLTGVGAVPAAYNQTQLANAFATIIAQCNAMQAALVQLGLIKGA